jgi:RNA polymerase sigma-70 factor (ECF subfamily)
MPGRSTAQFNKDDRIFMLALYKNYYSLARKTIFGIIHNAKDIEDLINDVFIRLIEKISLLRTFDCCKTTAYVVYTSRSVSINYIRHKKVENKHMYYSENIDTIENNSSSQDEFEENLVRQEEWELLSNAVSKLPQNQKDLLYFKYFLEMSDKDIAEKLGIGTASVRQYLTRARRSAKMVMGKEADYYAK